MHDLTCLVKGLILGIATLSWEYEGQGSEGLKSLGRVDILNCRNLTILATLFVDLSVMRLNVVHLDHKLRGLHLVVVVIIVVNDSADLVRRHGVVLFHQTVAKLHHDLRTRTATAASKE